MKWWCHASCGDFRMDSEQTVELYISTTVEENVEYDVGQHCRGEEMDLE